MRISLFLLFFVSLFLSACDSEVDVETSTQKPFSEIDLSGSWSVVQQGTYQETDTLNGQCSDGYPYESDPWDTTFTVNTLSMRGDTLVIVGWFVTQMNLEINFWGVGTGSSITLTGTRMNSPTTPWVEGGESYRAVATTQSDGTISLAITTYSQYYMGKSIHGQGETSTATLSR